MDATIEEILKDYISFTKWANILVLGQPRSGKTSIIDSILSSQYKYVNADSVDKFKDDMMILSQYGLDDFAIVTERVFQGFEESAAQNLQYFPLLKNDWNPAQIVGNGFNPESKYWKQPVLSMGCFCGFIMSWVAITMAGNRLVFDRP